MKNIEQDWQMMQCKADDSRSELSRNLAVLRKQNKMTQTDLSKLIGVSRATISFWENGSTQPSVYWITYLSLLYEVSVDYFLGLSDRKNIDLTDDEQILIKLKELSPRAKDMYFQLLNFHHFLEQFKGPVDVFDFNKVWNQLINEKTPARITKNSKSKDEKDL